MKWKRNGDTMALELRETAKACTGAETTILQEGPLPMVKQATIEAKANNANGGSIKIYTGDVEADVWKLLATLTLVGSDNDEARITDIGNGIKITGTRSGGTDLSAMVIVTLKA